MGTHYRYVEGAAACALLCQEVGQTGATRPSTYRLGGADVGRLRICMPLLTERACGSDCTVLNIVPRTCDVRSSCRHRCAVGTTGYVGVHVAAAHSVENGHVSESQRPGRAHMCHMIGLDTGHCTTGVCRDS